MEASIAATNASIASLKDEFVKAQARSDVALAEVRFMKALVLTGQVPDVQVAPEAARRAKAAAMGIADADANE